jgi:hypothetical protein
LFSQEAENESSSSEVEKKNDQLDLFSRGQVHDFMQPIFSNEKMINSLRFSFNLLSVVYSKHLK